MIDFKNEKQINEWTVDLENHVTLLKANLECDKRKCTVVEKTTDGFIFKKTIQESTKAIKNCASMIDQYLTT